MPFLSKFSNSTHSRFEGITGVVLAGGKSSRYGKNKALVELDGVRLIERVIGVMGSVFKHVIIITNTPHEYAYLQLPMFEDLIKGLGPIGGIYTGLEAISDDAGFFVACDMPFLNAPLVRHIVEIKDEYIKGLKFHYIDEMKEINSSALLNKKVSNPLKFEG